MALSRKGFIGPAKLLLAILPFLWIFSRTDSGRLAAVLGDVAWWTVPAVTLVMLAAVILQVLRWWILIVSLEPEVSFGRALSAHFKGLFYSIVLPTAVAQDALRAAILSKRADYGVVWGASWLCKLFGILSLLLLSLYGLASIESFPMRDQAFPTVLACLAAGGALLYLSFSKAVTSRLRPAFSALLPQKVSNVFEQIRQSVYQYRGKGKALTVVILISLFIQIVLVFNSGLLIWAVSGTFPILECLTFVPFIMISTMLLPLAPNGIGTREALYAVFFNFLGLSNEELGIFISINLGVILTIKALGALSLVLDDSKGDSGQL